MKGRDSMLTWQIALGLIGTLVTLATIIAEVNIHKNLENDDSKKDH